MIFDQLFEKRNSLENPSTSLSDPANWLLHAFNSAPASSGVLVSEKSATQITAFWSAVNTISDTLAELPVRLIRARPDGTNDVIQRHPALRLLRNPNPMMTPVTFRAMQMAATLVWGNSYGYIVRNRAGDPAELWPLPPNETTSKVIQRELFFDTRLDIGNTRLSGEDVLHIPALTRNGIDGMSIVAEQREMLGSAIAQQSFASRFFANGAKPSGLISYPGKVRDPNKIKDALERATGGENAHSMMILDQDAKFSAFSIPPEDAQFLQTREFSVDEIGRMFRLPLHFLNKMGQATFNNIEMMGTHFVQYTMMPWIIRHEQELTRKLLKPGEIDRGMRFKFNVAALIRGDIKTRSEVYAKAVQFGWMTRNEVRGLEDMNPLDGLDDPLVPVNLAVVGEEPEPAPEPAPDPEPDDEPDDEPDQDEAEDDTDDEDEENYRYFLVMTAMVQRLANKEANAVRRLAKRNDADGIIEFYDKHADHMIENLAMQPADARQYCDDRLKQLQDTEAEDVLMHMTTTDVARLVNQLTEGMTA